MGGQGGEGSMKSQTDKLGQPVKPGDIVVASFMVGRSHRFVRAEVGELTPQFANLKGLDRKVRFYNLVVINKLLPHDSGTSTREMIGRELGYGH